MINSQLRRVNGFSLVEMAVVLVIVGILLGGLLLPLSAQIDVRNYTDEKKSMDDINLALLGFAMSKGYLPCPASAATSGVEGRAGSACAQRVGFLPWATLGLRKYDSWGHLYLYSVTPSYADSSTKITLTTGVSGGDIKISSRNDSGAEVVLTTVGSLSPAVVISMGKNGLLAYNDDGTKIPNTSTTNVDEIANGTQSTSFFSRTFSTGADSTYGGEFDDLVTWISPSIYISKMVTANQLP